MERLAKLLAERRLKDSIFILWNTQHRITWVVSAPLEKKLKLDCKSIDKYFIPFVASWYTLKAETFECDKGKIREKLPRYLIFDGHRLLDWKDADGRTKREHWFDRDFFASGNEFQYKTAKYLKDITQAMHTPSYMQRWVLKPQVRYRMMYKVLHFLARSGIDPCTYRTAESSFSPEIKKTIVQNHKTAVGPKAIKTIEYNKTAITLVKDVVGLWTVSHATKNAVLSQVDAIQAYGADNADASNGVLLDSRINRRKGNTMLFLVGDDIIQDIDTQKKAQRKWLRSQYPWYKRFLVPSIFLQL
ncbi:hypothetical protein HDU91_007170 [Kappamyces sp. JEL0680]|nr:hypothetical protein HDU91_007170 [Kappamyces sp. JEL0680]